MSTFHDMGGSPHEEKNKFAVLSTSLLLAVVGTLLVWSPSSSAQETVSFAATVPVARPVATGGVRAKSFPGAAPRGVSVPFANSAQKVANARPIEARQTVRSAPILQSTLGQPVYETQTAHSVLAEYEDGYDTPEAAFTPFQQALAGAFAAVFLSGVFYQRRQAMLAMSGAEASFENTEKTSMLAVSGTEEKKSGFPFDWVLLVCLSLWYLGNYQYNIANKIALNATGGAVAGCPLTVASAQLFVGVIYAFFLWVAPDARAKPKVTFKDLVSMLPLAICFAGSHFSTVVCMGAGAVSFGQIVKAAEPAWSALLGTFAYGKTISKGKWLCLIPVIGGVALASLGELSFSWLAMFAGISANLFAAAKGQENKKLMETEGIKERIGSIGNQYALTLSLAWVVTLPIVLLKEGFKFGEFLNLWQTNPAVSMNIIAAGLWFYVYNELATIVVKKTGPVTQSVANTAKRVIVIVGVAFVLGESLTPLKLIGSAIGISGVFLYSMIDRFFPPKTVTPPPPPATPATA